MMLPLGSSGSYASGNQQAGKNNEHRKYAEHAWREISDQNKNKK